VFDVPDAGEIGFAIGGSRRRRGEIGLSPASAQSTTAMPVTIFMATSGCAQDATPAAIGGVGFYTIAPPRFSL